MAGRPTEPSTLTPERKIYAQYLLNWSKNPVGMPLSYGLWMRAVEESDEA